MGFLKNLLLFFVASLICIAFLEISSRILKLHGDTDPTYILNDTVMPFSMKPDSSSKSIYGKNFRINNHGLRGPDFHLSRKDQVKRILILGDSVAYGYCVNYDETFSGILHQQLASSAEFEFEVINAGHNGFNIKDSTSYYKNYGKHFSPDIVIIAVTASDNTNQSLEYIIKDGIGYSKNSKWISVPSFVKKILRNSSLYMTIGVVKARIDFMRTNNQSNQSTMTGNNSLIDSVRIAVNSLKEATVINNTPLVIISVPSKIDVENQKYNENFFGDIESLSLNLGIQFIDTLGYFKKNQNNFCLNDHAHPNEIGHKAIANAIYQNILNYYNVNTSY